MDEIADGVPISEDTVSWIVALLALIGIVLVARAVKRSDDCDGDDEPSDYD